ncbi:MAG: Stage II sporulation protein [Parcubacteria group bacterium GW2011_GWA2_33_14]|uniref:STAS domain-containing protein n=1 Tax=Candidatus Staskawiczbacteria bacterium RIFCSPHIGHO2_02_FULL_33_16 TaxID=1802204 RepID=A0A1G2HV36_9BACT|nr:MAG: Stage II sporulation protein [Parcubacteria group bacterium GW2011_GWA2_33_14]OGZ65718.1 MAG: hypothetical protein A3D34_03425 [Candidatus Staskawiczbacteria bacterium RIFCSPHIGHO2_02_FULL_33_16]OGZ70281.1 MAG: hypothetical protein A2980_01915 [Candidatus Staskawiczbacteria bacterium RIFCSPLOWO2_01_FULL_33_13]
MSQEIGEESEPRKFEHIEVKYDGDICVVTFINKRIMGDSIIEGISTELLSIANDLDIKKIILDFGRVEYLQHSTLLKLSDFVEKIKGRNGRIVACNLNNELHRLFAVTEFNRFLPLVKTEKNAIDIFGIK